MASPLDDEELIRRIGLDLVGGYDEELELEMEDRHPLPGLSEGADGERDEAYRHSYFHQLFRLQGELVKRHAVLHAGGVRRVLPLRPGVRAHACPLGHPPAQVTDEEQHLRFLGRIHDPLKQWKSSAMDLESRRRWEDYTKAKETMLQRSHIPEARWWVVHAVDKKRARLNCIDHLLKQFPHGEVEKAPIVLPERERPSALITVCRRMAAPARRAATPIAS